MIRWGHSDNESDDCKNNFDIFSEYIEPDQTNGKPMVL